MSSSLYKVDTAPSSTSEHLNITKSDANLTLTLISESGAEFESLEQLGPTVSSILKTKRTDQFLDQLDAFAHKKEMEVERLCKEHYHDFVVAVESLTSIRDGTRELRDRIVHLNDTLQVTGQELVDKRVKLMEAKSIHRNMSQGVDSLAQCLNVLRLVARAKHQLDSHALFAALQTLEELENVHLRRVSQYTFSQRLARRIPLMREAVQDSVIADLKEWFYQLRDLSRKAGTLAMKRARDRQVRWRRLSQQRKQMGFSSSILELVMDEENEGDILDNEEVHIDFRPLYQCIHIHSTLGKANSFRKMYEEDRQAQVDLIVSPSVNFNAPEALKSMGKMLQELVGFFIVDHVVVHTTQEFRSKARVDVLWTMVSDKVTRLIADATRKCSDLQRLFEIRKMLMCFVSALEGYLYDCHKPRELMVILAERYAALIMEGCGERFRKIVDEDEYRPMQVSSEEELEAVRSAYPFQESTQGLVSQGSTREGRVSKDSSYSSPSAGRSTGSFPRTLPFSTILPLCCVDVKRCISEYYQYVAGEDGHAAVAAADSVLQQAVDGYLTKMVLPALLAKLRSTILSQVVQIVINMEYFESACGEFERFLYNQRISPHLDMPQGEDGSVGRVKLRARAGFVEAKIRCERRVYELVNIKIDQFLDLSNYSWMPSTPIPEPSQYMVDLVGYLKMVFTSVLVDLRPQIRKLVRFEAVDHLATSLTTLLFGSKVTQFNRNFILCAQADIQTLQTFLEELGDPNLLDTLTELQQTVELLLSDNRDEYLDLQIRNKKYSRLKPTAVIQLFERYR